MHQKVSRMCCCSFLFFSFSLPCREETWSLSWAFIKFSTNPSISIHSGAYAQNSHFLSRQLSYGERLINVLSKLNSIFQPVYLINYCMGDIAFSKNVKKIKTKHFNRPSIRRLLAHWASSVEFRKSANWSFRWLPLRQSVEFARVGNAGHEI